MNDWSERTALVAEVSPTHREVRQQGHAIACALRTAGIQAGDSVAIATSHKAAFYTFFVACFEAGFPVVVLDAEAPPGELMLMLRASSPAVLIADEAVLVSLDAAMNFDLPQVVWRVAASAQVEAREWPSLASIQAGDFVDDMQPADESMPAYVMFTSGTTATPKGVVVSRAALRHHVATLSKVFAYDSKATLLCFLPTHHTDGLVHGVATSLLTGMTVMQPGAYTSSTNLESMLREHEISHFLTVPTMLAMIMRTFGDCPTLFQYAAFRSVISTAGYLDEALWEKFQQRFSVRLANFYGMTETVSGTLFCGPADATYQFGSLGKPVDAEVRIVDQGGNVVPPDTVGELQVAGEHLMQGYLNAPEATAAVLRDGWLSTGDLFSREACGVFHFVGRQKTIIKRGGVTVYPEDICRLVSAISGVVEAEVIGVPDAMFEEIIAVCVVVEQDLDVAEIRSACAAGLAAERRPDRIEIMDELPRGRSGKVSREQLLELLSERVHGSHDETASVREQVLAVAAVTFAVEPSELHDQSSPETLANWDSYAGMEFVLALEKAFSVRLRPRDIMRLSDIGKAIEIISASADAQGIRFE